MKCNHKKTTTPFCPACGIRLHQDGIKSELLYYMADRLAATKTEIENTRRRSIDPERPRSNQEFFAARIPGMEANVERWNRWIEWLIKQDASS